MATLTCCSGTNSKPLLGKTCSRASWPICSNNISLAGTNMFFKQTLTCLNSINQLLLWSLEMRKHPLSQWRWRFCTLLTFAYFWPFCCFMCSFGTIWGIGKGCNRPSKNFQGNKLCRFYRWNVLGRASAAHLIMDQVTPCWLSNGHGRMQPHDISWDYTNSKKDQNFKYVQ